MAARNRMSPAYLADTHGRIARDLRVSLTDRCNLRCTYCMPPEGLHWAPQSELLSFAEFTRLLRLAVEDLGILGIRFTGGEPLLRRDLEDLVSFAASLTTWEGRCPDLALTTNALGLAKRAAGLAQAGLKRVNISLDTLDPAYFRRVTLKDRLRDVLDGIAEAQSAGFSPIKINTVALDEQWLEGLPELLRYCLSHDLQLRVIEHMPLGPASSWERRAKISAARVQEYLRDFFTLTARAGNSAREDAASPASLWDVSAGDYSGTIGFIASVTQAFCVNCDRTRLTAKGEVISCLFDARSTSLRELLRSGASDADLAQVWRDAQMRKPAAHGISGPNFIPPPRLMGQVGG